MLGYLFKSVLFCFLRNGVVPVQHEQKRYEAAELV